MKKTALILLVLAGAAQADNVTVYDRAPSVEELQRQLTGAAEAPMPQQRKVRTRAIVFGDAAPAPQEAAPAVLPAPQAQQAPQQQATYQQTAAPPAAAAPAVQVSERAIAFPINFRVNSSDILPESVPFLESIAGLLNKDPSMRLVVEGHTDASGTHSRNLALSRERAFSVMNYLIDHYRIDPLRLVPVGKGFSEPLGGLEPENPKNRRVQFRIIG
ncbi:MAG: OmpA family protein [Pseudomonadota bacterium]